METVTYENILALDVFITMIMLIGLQRLYSGDCEIHDQYVTVRLVIAVLIVISYI